MAAGSAAAVMALGALTVPQGLPDAWAQDDLEKKKDRVEQQIDSAHSDLDESSAAFRGATIALRGATAKLAAAQSRLAEVRGRLTAARVRDRELAAQLDAAMLRLAEARKAVDHGKRQVSDQRDQVAEVVSDIYTEGDPELLAFASLLEAQTPADLTRRAEARRIVVGEETRAYDDLRAAEVLLLVEEDKVEEARDEVARRREEAAERLREMERLERDAEAAKAKVRGLVTQRYAAQSRANRARARDLQALRQLEREQDRISEMLRKRAEAARRRAAARAAAEARRGVSRSHSREPRDAGGFLDYPVEGYVTSPFGMRVHPIYGYTSLHDGVDFGASCGAPLYAAAGGQVVERYYSDVWGNRLIVANGYVDGKGVATIYNHAVDYVVGVGDRVRRGQLVGYVGTTGWSTGCHLHFTVMASGTAVDPMNWF